MSYEHKRRGPRRRGEPCPGRRHDSFKRRAGLSFTDISYDLQSPPGQQHVAVFEASTGKQIFTQTYTADELEGSLLALNVGAFGSVESLRALAEKALNEVVDRALDDTALRNAMHRPGM